MTLKILTQKKKSPIGNQCTISTWLTLEQPVQLERVHGVTEASPNLRQRNKTT